MAENREMRSRKRNPRKTKNLASVKRTVAELGEEEEESDLTDKPYVVRVPRAEMVVPPPVAAEAKVAGKFSHPVIRWQLYALGGYLILRWAWRRWKERRSRDDDDK